MQSPLLALAALFLAPLLAVPQDAAPEQLTLRDWLVIEPVDARGRRPFAPDAVFARYLLDPDAAPPAAGETITGEHGRPCAWVPLEAQENGRLEGLPVAWAYARLELDEGGVWMAELSRAHTLFVNGAGFPGDYYGYGKRAVPVELRAGVNHIFITGTRGAPVLSFERPPAELFVADRDLTRPDLVAGEARTAQLGPRVVNASTRVIRGVDWSVWTERTQGGRTLVDGSTFLFPLAPLAVAKPTVRVLMPKGDGPAPLGIWAGRGVDSKRPVWAKGIELARVAPDALRVETFRSRIDGSVQEYALRPAGGEAGAGAEQGLVLSLHGAGVQCRRQAGSYGTYADLWIVAPTNRRRFGFDWQDWGRSDAYEVLEHALELSGASRERIYLTGHSMGGHGTWHLGANDPDTWAAIAPSAGWESFDSYGGRPRDELSDLWQDADAPSRTLSLIDNLVQLPTFVLHGEADDNVRVTEARAMIAALEAAGASPGWHIEPGKKHWWNGDAAPGADCLTWPGIFELFDASRRPVDPLALDFTTVDPVVDAAHHWLRVDQALSYGAPIRVRAALESEDHDGTATLRVRTDNARRIALTPPVAWPIARAIVDGFHFDWPYVRSLELVRVEGAWELAPPLAADEKRAERSGPFKRAFDRDFVLVYGTAGEESETAELLARARFDAGTWGYRANGHTWILSDRQLLSLTRRGVTDRCNVILYGNRDTNSAWTAMLPESCPVTARRGAITVGTREWRGDDLACLFVQPRRGTEDCLVGVFADSGVRGARLGYRTQTFISGAGFPDLALVSAEVLTRGDAGVRVAGWFDAGWGWRRGRIERGYIQSAEEASGVVGEALGK